MRAWWILVLLGVLSGASWAGDPLRFPVIRQHALAAPPALEKSIPKLAEYLQRGCRDDEEKAWAVYAWVTDRIAYDGPAFLSGHIPPQTAENTLRTRLSVCAGYAELYAALGKSMGLKVEVVEGWAKGYGYKPGEAMKDPNHAWNLVQSGRRSWLVDSTWGAGNLSEDGKFSKSFNDFWFRAKPDRFIYSHLPQAERCQLLSPARSKAAFEALPWYDTGFFRWGLRAPEPPRRTADGWEMGFETPVNVRLEAGLELDGKRLEGYTLVEQHEPGRARVSVHFPQAGKYEVLVFASYQGAHTFEGAARFAVETRAGGGSTFPVTYRSDMRVMAPRDGQLSAGDTDFRLVVPGVKEVRVGGTALTANGQEFSGRVNLKSGPAVVYETRPDGSGWSILQYQVR